MAYTKEEIDFFSDILENYKKTKKPKPICKIGCKNCKEDNFSILFGQNICDNCGVFNGYVLGYYNIGEKERFFYRKKSIYNRKYHYIKKIDKVGKRLNLTDNEKDKLYNKLIVIDNNVILLLNKKFNKKRMININYLIKKILEELEIKKYKLFHLKISLKTLEKYNKWWDHYKNIISI